MRPTLRLVLVLLATLMLSTGVSRAQQSTPIASFASAQPTVTPLQPMLVNVHIQNYSGPATLLVFDPQHRIVGSWEVTIKDDYGSVQVTPRGGLGPQWAALFANGHKSPTALSTRLMRKQPSQPMCPISTSSTQPYTV